MNNNFETMADMQRMQQEAVRRVHEMQRRAKQTLIADQKNNDLSYKKEPAAATSSNMVEQPSNESSQPKTKPVNKNMTRTAKNINSGNNFNFLSSIISEPEKALILLLILLLLDETTDIGLVFALMYLLV